MSSDKLGAALYNVESSWGEDSTSFSVRMPVLASVDVSGLEQTMIDPDRVVQYRNDGTPGIRGPQGGGFSTEFYITGHGSTTSGATSLTSLYTLLGYVFGASAVSASAGTTLTGGTAAVPTTTASGTFSAGGICRVGAVADARGGGQFYSIATHTTTTLTLLNALGGAPTNGDVLYSCEQAYTVEAPSTSDVTGLRWNLQTARQQFTAHGCFAKAVSFSGLNAGELPKIKIDWGCSWFAARSATFPSATSVEVFTPKSVSQGSLMMAAVGTTTRTARTIRSFSLDYSLGVVPLMGPNGVGVYQAIVGAKRTPDNIVVTIEEDAEAATTTPALAAIYDASADGTAYQMLYTLNAVAGSAVALGFHRMHATGPRPTQHAADGLTRSRLSMKALTSTTNTNDLTSAAFILAGA